MREVHDPGIGFLTITRVKVSPDLQQARVYYTTIGDEKARKETAQGARPRDAVPAPPDRPAPAAEARARSSSSSSTSASRSSDRIERILQELNAERAEPAGPRLDDEPADDESTDEPADTMINEQTRPVVSADSRSAGSATRCCAGSGSC